MLLLEGKEDNDQQVISKLSPHITEFMAVTCSITIAVHFSLVLKVRGDSLIFFKNFEMNIANRFQINIQSFV